MPLRPSYMLLPIGIAVLLGVIVCLLPEPPEGQGILMRKEPLQRVMEDVVPTGDLLAHVSTRSAVPPASLAVPVGNRARPVTMAPDRPSHSLAHYVKPGEIRSFLDRNLANDYNVYFSLIGPAKEDFPFSRSGFDTERNSAFAYKTIVKTDYTRPNRKTFEATLLAITHLTHSELPASRERLQSAAEALMRKIEHVPADKQRALMQADLALLLTAYEREGLSTLAQYYATSAMPSVRASIQFAMVKIVERQAKTRREVDETLATYDVPPLNVKLSIMTSSGRIR